MRGNAKGAPICVRCNRIRPSAQLIVIVKSPAATLRRCIDEDECDAYQQAQRDKREGWERMKLDLSGLDEKEQQAKRAEAEREGWELETVGGYGPGGRWDVMAFKRRVAAEDSTS